MNLLLDTHSLLWFLNEDPHLVPNAKALIEDSLNRKFVSMATCWEIAIKVGLKKLDLGEPVSTFLPRELLVNKFGLLHIELVHALHVENLPRHHRDPFDRLLVAQSIIEKIAIVSSDEKFDSYGVVRLWK
ncbi:type II toxin-antitoxin system VapC family toxin [bacterium]|nr:type II toxin-antitoxin system VapC family toxin [Gemmataceae bacterium]NBS89131.1 type II toxin-antitoxin system VapC family toxin [bacterium]NBT62073.1 type II toxin-antitoxin system VapC family toxin [Planctomycetia bacterium]